MDVFSKQNFSSRLAVAALTLLLLFLGNLKFRQWQNQRQIEKQEQSLQKQADDLQKQNNDLNQSLQYLNSADFKERVARQQLDLKRQGEQVYSFAQGTSQTDAAPQQNLGKSGNITKWWDYFFANN